MEAIISYCGTNSTLPSPFFLLFTEPSFFSKREIIGDLSTSFFRPLNISVCLYFLPLFLLLLMSNGEEPLQKKRDLPRGGEEGSFSFPLLLSSALAQQMPVIKRVRQERRAYLLSIYRSPYASSLDVAKVVWFRTA